MKIRRINFPDLQDNEQCTANLIGPVHAEGAGSSLLSDSEALKHSSLIASYVDIQWTIVSFLKLSTKMLEKHESK